MNRLLLCASLSLAACQCDPTQGTIRGNTDAGSDAGGFDAGTFDAGASDAGGRGDAGLDCIPPDVLIALDRTLTMHRTADGMTPPDTVAGHATSKWTMAINGLEQLWRRRSTAPCASASSCGHAKRRAA